MGKSMRVASYLSGLRSEEYGIAPAISGVVNFLLDSFFAKSDERLLRMRGEEDPSPSDPDSHIKEMWLGCEIHMAISLNQGYPAFAKNLHAWAFTRMFRQCGDQGCGYDVIPFLDQYQWKDLLKGRSSYRIQQEQLSIGLGQVASLPVYGTFFIERLDGVRLVVMVDFGFNMPGCSLTVLSHPEHQEAAEQFLRDFSASIVANDIYFRKCLTFVRGHLDFSGVTTTAWSDIILKKSVQDEIRDNTVGVLDSMEQLASLGMCPYRSVILISPPGMAKTTVFRAVSGETDGKATRIWCTGKSIEYPEHVTALFQAARTLAPCIIFIEDMDLFGKSRDSLRGAESQVLNEFLACLDGAQENPGIVVMASTNDIASMDEALVNRPGRFDVKIEIPYPDASDRWAMLKSFLQRLHASPDQTVTQESWKTVLDMTDGLTGAYIKELAKSAIIRSVARGGSADGSVTFSVDDLTSAAEQVMRNFRIGQKAARHIEDHASPS